MINYIFQSMVFFFFEHPEKYMVRSQPHCMENRGSPTNSLFAPVSEK